MKFLSKDYCKLRAVGREVLTFLSGALAPENNLTTMIWQETLNSVDHTENHMEI